MSPAACGSVNGNMPGDDAPGDAAPDAWAMTCAPSATITAVEDSDDGYGDDCIHGSWLLQAPNGETVPATAAAALHTVAVFPVAIGATDHPNGVDPTSTRAISVSGRRQQNEPGGIGYSYAQLTATLNTPAATQIGSVDARQFAGFEFDGIIIAPSGARVSIANKYTDPSGGLCDPHPNIPLKSCFDNPNQVLATSTDWTHYRIAFKDLVQLGFGMPSPTGDAFPRDGLINIRWDIDIPATDEAPPWQLWIDNLRFY